MNFGIRFRLTVLGLAVGLMGVLIALIMLSSQRQVAELQARLSSVDSESSGIMNQFEESLGKLNGSMLRYGTDHDPAVWQTCLDASHDLNAWIRKQGAVLRTPAEKNLLRQIETAYVNYWQVSRDFHAKAESRDGRSATLADFTPVRERSHLLFGLGQALARAHHQSQSGLQQHASQSLKQLYHSMLVLLGLLFVFGIALAVGIYRHLIAPLHVRLAHTRDLAALREKLASLGLLASDAAHEARNPLTSIKIGVSFQKNKFPPGTVERADAEAVEREVMRLERILNDLLALTQLAAPRMSPLKLDAFLHELRAFLAPQLAATNVRFATEILTPMQVRADAAQLKQAVISLVQNAANRPGRNGGITLRARPDRKLLAGNETNVAVLEVTDAGKDSRPEKENQACHRPFPPRPTVSIPACPSPCKSSRSMAANCNANPRPVTGLSSALFCPDKTAGMGRWPNLAAAVSATI